MEASTPTSPSNPTPGAAETLLHHFPDHVRAAYVQLRATGDAAAADTLVLAIVADHMLRKDTLITETAELVRDLGFDSVAITEMVFFLEDLLAVNVSNEEILRVRTVGDLRSFVREKLATQLAAARTADRA